MVLSIVVFASCVTSLPSFPQSWSVHEDQLAKVAGSTVKWHGHVYNDMSNISRAACTPSVSKKHPRNCSATAYVDDKGEKSTFDFYEINQNIRGLTYFVQGKFTPCYCDMDVLDKVCVLWVTYLPPPCIASA